MIRYDIKHVFFTGAALFYTTYNNGYKEFIYVTER